MNFVLFTRFIPSLSMSRLIFLIHTLSPCSLVIPGYKYFFLLLLSLLLCFYSYSLPVKILPSSSLSLPLPLSLSLFLRWTFLPHPILYYLLLFLPSSTLLPSRVSKKKERDSESRDSCQNNSTEKNSFFLLHTFTP